MYLTSYNPYSLADKVFENFFDSKAETNSVLLTPRVDVHDENNKLVLEAELPGVKKEDIKVDFAAGVLSISAEKRHEKEVQNKNRYLAERTYGKYERRFRLSDDLDAEQISAKFENGILRLEIGRKQGAVPRQISIK